ncbi:MAG: cytochrome c3 family protein [Bryobacteraceae bacterium]
MVWLKAAAVLVILTAAGRAQVSPGPLSLAHQSLEGTTKCATCHNFGLGTRGLKCLECHVEIRRRLTENKGYHARSYKASDTQADCARCHMEHNGRQFLLTRLDRKKFEHRELTGFALEGKHAQLNCGQCHKPSLIPAGARSEIKVRDLDKTFLGLGNQCRNCHEDPHAGQLGDECSRCHGQNAWKPAETFDHSRSNYPLTGLHQNVACAKCHGPKPGETAAHYKGIPFINCQSCHADPHGGSFKGACQSCHSTAGWKSILPTNTFDHDKTKFPLHGKHVETACSKCHKNDDFKTPIAHDLCRDCHEDVHHGQFEGRAAGGNCKACHDEEKFKPALYTREMHQQSAFKLEGKHFQLECEKCHQPAGKDAAYKTGKVTCVACHPDSHGDEFRSPPYENRCEMCHSQESFRPSTFTMARHAKTKFVLANAHSAVPCGDCHKPLSTALNANAAQDKGAPPHVALQYHFSDQSCSVCHADPHSTKLTCETCHNTRNWKELRTFDHTSTKFALEGAHQRTGCIDCHKPAAPAPPTDTARVKISADFSHTPKQCFECHDDIHGGQFMTPGKEQDCSSCHSVTKWNSATFDHDKTSYPLDGAHSKVGCAQCHMQQKEIDGRVVRMYGDARTRCEGCHKPELNGKKSAP